jgi:hypothetical protein
VLVEKVLNKEVKVVFKDGDYILILTGKVISADDKFLEVRTVKDGDVLLSIPNIIKIQVLRGGANE